jgi:hypothetical protein
MEEQRPSKWGGDEGIGSMIDSGRWELRQEAEHVSSFEDHSAWRRMLVSESFFSRWIDTLHYRIWVRKCGLSSQSLCNPGGLLRFRAAGGHQLPRIRRPLTLPPAMLQCPFPSTPVPIAIPLLSFEVIIVHVVCSDYLRLHSRWTWSHPP